MSTKVKFIGPDYLKENTTIQQNVDDNIINPYIDKAQAIYIQQALGTTFYEHLKTAVLNSTLNSDEDYLLRNYIQPCLAEWTLYEALPFIQNKLTNKSINKQNSEFSETTDLDTLIYLRNSVRNMAEFFEKRLVTYLCDNSNLFPQYMNPDAKENLHKSSRAYFNGVYIPRPKKSNIRSYNDPSDDCYDC